MWDFSDFALRSDPLPFSSNDHRGFLARACESLRTHASGWISVRDLGAIGDGVADDTLAIQAAIDLVTTTVWSGAAAGQYVKGGGTVLFPAGVYRITSTLRVGAHTRLVGLGTRGFFHPAQTQTITDLTKQKGTVIYADFSEPDAWALESANFVTATGLPLAFTAASSGAELDAGTVSHTHGIEIEGIYFKSGATPVYGAVRLNASPNSVIRRCGVYGFKIGFEVSGSWDVRVEDCWSITHWYGVVLLRTVNAASISGYFNRIGAPAALVDVELPNGIWAAVDYTAGGLSAAYRTAATGVYANYADSIDVRAVTESWDLGGQLINGSGTVTRLHVERAATVAVAMAAAAYQAGSLYNFAAVPVPALHVGGGSTLALDVLTGNSSATFLNLASTSLVRLADAFYSNNAQRLLVDTSGVKATPFRVTRIAATYGVAVAINAATGNWHSINATNGVGFTISNPTNPVVGQFLTVTIKNTSGGALGAVAWDTAYKLAAWTSPANGSSRSITFAYDGVASWVEVSRTPADVPN